MSSLMTSMPNSGPGSRPVSTLKYELFAALAVVLLRGVIFVTMQKTAIEYHSNGTVSLMVNNTDAVIDTLILGFINLPCYCVAGLLAARRLGMIRAGVRTGLKAGLFSGLATYAVPAIITAVWIGLLLLIASGLPHSQDGYEQTSRALIWWWVRAILLNDLLILAFDAVCGTLMGLLGGVLSKWR